MFTPEDEIDELHLELGTWRRRLEDASRGRGSGGDYVEREKWISRCRFHVDRLERALAVALEEQRAADEALAEDRA